MFWFYSPNKWIIVYFFCHLVKTLIIFFPWHYKQTKYLYIFFLFNYISFPCLTKIFVWRLFTFLTGNFHLNLISSHSKVRVRIKIKRFGMIDNSTIFDKKPTKEDLTNYMKTNILQQWAKLIPEIKLLNNKMWNNSRKGNFLIFTIIKYRLLNKYPNFTY